MPVMVLDPNVRAGWEPDTPLEDSLLRRFLVNWTASIEAHGLPLGGRMLRRDDLAAVDLGRPSFGANVATLTAPLFPEGVEEVTAALDEFYGFSRGVYSGTAFLFSAWPTPDLRPHGWKLLGYEALMLRPAGGVQPTPRPVCGLRRSGMRQGYAPSSLRSYAASNHPSSKRKGPARCSAPPS